MSVAGGSGWRSRDEVGGRNGIGVMGWGMLGGWKNR